jgi:glycosyltransferase involved in cell wall biosynthesis
VRVLLIAFYFPPAGGGGVQRTLKLCRYLPEFGVDVDVLAPTDPKWLAHDEPLLARIPETTTVHRSRFPGPRSALRADELEHAGSAAGRIAVQARHALQRGLVPDKTVGWAATAVPAAIRIVRRRHVDALITTSPTHSTHLIGAAVARASGTPWVADFRDSWLVNPHRSYERAGVRAKRLVERRMAGMVVRRADALTCVTPAIAAELGGLDPAAAGRIHVIGHGVDFDDFAGLPGPDGEPFTIVHAGAFFGRRTPRPFLEALAALLDRRPDLRGRVRARFVGDLRATDRAWARSLGLDGAWEETGFLPHDRTLAAERSADALLLLIPHAEGRGDTVVSGKLFEYIAARRPILAAVPPGGVAAALVREVGAGEVVDPDDVAGISAALEALCDRKPAGLPDVDIEAAVGDRLSRRARAGEMAAVLRGVAR